MIKYYRSLVLANPNPFRFSLNFWIEWISERHRIFTKFFRCDKSLYLAFPYLFPRRLDQSSGAAEYTDCMSVEDLPSPRLLFMILKKSDVEAPVMLGLWGMQICLYWYCWPGVVAIDRILSMGQIELTCVLMLNWILWKRTGFTFTWCIQ